MMKLKSKKGFTLVELVIVITVLAILAAVGIPVVSGIVKDANSSADNANIALFEAAIERYAADMGETGGKGEYPANGTEAGTAIKAYTKLTEMPKPKSDSGSEFVYDSTSHKVAMDTTGSAIVFP